MVRRSSVGVHVRGRRACVVLARVIGEEPADRSPDSTVLEIAALMARARSPLVDVVAGRQMLGAITLDALLYRMLAP